MIDITAKNFCFVAERLFFGAEKFCSSTRRKAHLHPAATAKRQILLDSCMRLCPGYTAARVGVTLKWVRASAVP